MKKLLIIPLLLACYVGMGQTASSIIGKPLKIRNLFVAQHDFRKMMNWDDAKKSCASLGKGWRLPDKDELDILYQYKGVIGGFVNDEYWSSTEKGTPFAFYQNFKNDWKNTNFKHFTKHVRAVKDL